MNANKKKISIKNKNQIKIELNSFILKYFFLFYFFLPCTEMRRTTEDFQRPVDSDDDE
jgi:hypothetical protein